MSAPQLNDFILEHLMGTLLCISGQIRGDINAVAEYADLARRHEAAVVISTWNKSGFKDAGPMRLPQRIRVFGPLLAETIPIHWTFPDLWAHYPELEAEKERLKAPITVHTLQSIFTGTPSLIEVESEAISASLSFQLETWDSNSKRMAYKIWRANELKRQLEREHGRRYDRVIRVRPDFRINDRALTDQLDLDRKVYAPWASYVGLADEAAIGSSESMDQYARLYDICSQEPRRVWGGIHRELQALLTGAGIEAITYGIGSFRVEGELEQQFRDVIRRREDPVSLIGQASIMISKNQLEDSRVLLQSIPTAEPGLASSVMRTWARWYQCSGQHDIAASVSALALYDIAAREAAGPDRPYVELARKYSDVVRQDAIPAHLSSYVGHWEHCMNLLADGGACK